MRSLSLAPEQILVACTFCIRGGHPHAWNYTHDVKQLTALSRWIKCGPGHAKTWRGLSLASQECHIYALHVSIPSPRLRRPGTFAFPNVGRIRCEAFIVGPIAVWGGGEINIPALGAAFDSLPQLPPPPLLGLNPHWRQSPVRATPALEILLLLPRTSTLHASTTCAPTTSVARVSSGFRWTRQLRIWCCIVYKLFPCIYCSWVFALSLPSS